MRVRVFCCTVLASMAATCCGWAQTKFETTRSTLDKWVETRQLISKTKAEWTTDKESLQQRVALLEKEVSLLDEQIAKAEATTTQAEKERAALLEENEALEAASVVVKKLVGEMEKDVVAASKFFPEPLMDRVEPLFKRIPDKPETTALSLSERMQNVVGILTEVDKFNGGITVTGELRKLPSGEFVQVKTVYLGLGVAYYVDKGGELAGIGTPSEDGWTWTPRNDLAASVSKLIFVYENAAAAVFVNLPISIITK